jgi:hypothetical protein
MQPHRLAHERQDPLLLLSAVDADLQQRFPFTAAMTCGFPSSASLHHFMGHHLVLPVPVLYEDAVRVITGAVSLPGSRRWKSVETRNEESVPHAALLETLWLDAPVRDEPVTGARTRRFRLMLLACAAACVTAAVVLGMAGELG